MPSRTGSTRAHALVRLQLEAPIPDNANLHQLQEQVADCVREANRREAIEPDELISTVVDAVARDYFQYTLRKQGRPRG
jgi:hypothetical protein